MVGAHPDGARTGPEEAGGSAAKARRDPGAAARRAGGR